MQITETQLRSILAGIGKVIDGPGFGTLEIVIEKRRVVRIRTTVDEWIEARPPTCFPKGESLPKGQVGPASMPQGGSQR